MDSKLTVTLITIALATLLGGCASQTTTEVEFGNSVRDVTMNQTYDVGATLDSEPDTVVGGDPYQLENAINGHRERSAQSSGGGYKTHMSSGNRR